MIKNIENPHDLKYAIQEFEDVAKNHTDKQKAELGLKILIAVCRFLDKVEWKIEVDAADLVRLTSHLCSFILNLSDIEYKKYVAVLCNIHRCVVKKKCSITLSTELLRCIFDKPTLKLRSDQSKNYFIMLVDGFQVLDNEKEPSKSIKILSDMAIQYFQTIDTLVMDNFIWLMRKFDSILNTVDPRKLNILYKNFFATVMNNKKLVKVSTENEMYTMFKKLLFALPLIHSNINKCGNDTMDCADLYFKMSLHLFQTNESFCKIFHNIAAVFPVFTTPPEKINSCNVCQVLSNFLYKLFSLRDSKQSHTLEEICLILKKILCSSFSSWVSVSNEVWKKHISIDLQLSALQLINAIIKVMSKSQLQTVQCVNCNFTSAIHDSLSLSYFGGMFCMKSIKCNMDPKGLFHHIEETFTEHTHSLKILHINGCPNWKMFWKKMENSQHNDSILLYSNKYYEHSQRMFDLYINNFIRVLNWSADESDLSYIAKGFYNMAICQSDLDQNYSALISCYISLAINNAIKNGVACDLPHLQLIIQVKSKVYSQTLATAGVENSEDNKIVRAHQGKNSEELQLLNIWNACKDFTADKNNAVFYKIFAHLKFENLLLSELKTYFQTWPSTNLIAGICVALQEMACLSNSVCKPAASSPDNIGILNSTDIIVACGKAVTLIVKHSAKLSNPKIAEMINSTSKLLESLLQSQRQPSDIAFIKLLWANTLFARGMCRMYEKRKLGAQNPLVEVAPNVPFAPHHPNVHPDDACDVAPAHQYLNLQVEDEIMDAMYKAMHLWKEVVTALGSFNGVKLESESMKSHASLSCDVIELCCQVFALHNNEYSLLAADIAYSLSSITDNTVCGIRSVGYLVENASSCTIALDEVISKTNEIVYKTLSKDDEKPESVVLVDSCLEYLLSLSIYYHNIGSIHQGAIILSSVSHRIFHLYVGEKHEGRNLDDIKITYIKMLKAQNHFISKCQNKDIKNDMFSILTCHINANIDCGDIVKSYEHNRGRLAVLSQRMWLESGSTAGQVALSLGLVRRARALLRGPLSVAQRLLLPRRAAHLLTLLAFADLVAERHDDCMVKVDGITYILGEQNSSRNKKNDDVPNIVSKKHIREDNSNKLKKINDNNFEMVLDVPVDKRSVGGSPTFRPTPFALPAFTTHVRSCQCYKCNSVNLFILYINFFKLQAELQFRNGETRIAGSYYKGGMKFIKYLFTKLDHIKDKAIGALINHFGLKIFHEYNYLEMVSAECHFINDSVTYYITEDEIETAQKLNAQVLETAKKYLSTNYFLIHMAEEQRLFISQTNVFKKYTSTMSQLDIMDDLQSDLSSKLIITPEKTKPSGNLLTPCDKKYPAINRVQRNVRNTSPTSAMKKEVTNFVHPAIKLRLEDADNDETENNRSTLKKNKAKVPEQRTPAPTKFRNAKIALLFDDPVATPRTRTRKLVSDENQTQSGVKAAKTKSVVPPVQEAPAITVLFGDKAHPKVYANKAARNTMKVTLSPNNLHIESNVVNNTNQLKSKANGEVLKNCTKENELKAPGTRSNPAFSNNTRLRGAQKNEDKDANKVLPVATRHSTRKRL